MFQGAGSEAGTEILQCCSHFIKFSDFLFLWSGSLQMSWMSMHAYCLTLNKMHIYLPETKFHAWKRYISLFCFFQFQKMSTLELLLDDYSICISFKACLSGHIIWPLMWPQLQYLVFFFFMVDLPIMTHCFMVNSYCFLSSYKVKV